METYLANLRWQEILFGVFCLVIAIQLFYYGWFFSRLAFYKTKTREKTQQHPVSVIICAKDEAAKLAANLPGALVQSYPTSHEIIVVNHTSQDDTRFLLDELKKTFKGLHIVNLQHDAIGIPGKKYPLSVGIKEARHEIVLLTDADCVPASEFWIEKMQNAYDDGIEVVLGYGAYHKKSGLLNKLIRFETFHAALQYFSFALAGQPYMGVGRNLSYKKELFFKNKGFSSINHLPGGDDDLFINKVANDRNTAIVIDPETFTLSDTKRTFGAWMQQKTRHYSAAKFYKARHKFMLGLYSLTQFLLYPLLVACVIYFSWQWTVVVFGMRFVVQAMVYFKTMKRLNESDLFAWWWLFDVWMFLYYLIFVPALWKKPPPSWN